MSSNAAALENAMLILASWEVDFPVTWRFRPEMASRVILEITISFDSLAYWAHFSAINAACGQLLRCSKAPRNELRSRRIFRVVQITATVVPNYFGVLDFNAIYFGSISWFFRIFPWNGLVAVALATDSVLTNSYKEIRSSLRYQVSLKCDIA